MKRLDYEAPTMEEIVVEMENGFLGGSADVENPNNQYGKIENHDINTDFDVDFSDEKNGNWVY